LAALSYLEAILSGDTSKTIDVSATVVPSVDGLITAL